MPLQKMPEALIHISTLYENSKTWVAAFKFIRLWLSDGIYTISWGNKTAGDTGSGALYAFAELCMVLMGLLLIVSTSPS